ncbi:MAG: hypothetical protein OEV91_02480 [Desulfobulbaceae bacterium]|nr:hypothetical protein [Desulfobulbaceae bacterium]
MNPIPVTYRGVEYPSVAALARDHGVHPSSLHNRVKMGVAVNKYMVPTHGRTLKKVATRGEWLVQFGESVTGLCTSAIWAEWGKVLRLLYRDHSTIAIGELFGAAPRVIQMDLKEFDIETRGKGGANHRTIKYRRLVQQAAIEEVRALQRDRRSRMSKNNMIEAGR